MVTIERVPCGMVNCWLIRGREGGILVDAAVSRYRYKLLERLEDERLRLIFLTHGHADHIGCAAFLSRALRIPIGMSQQDMALVADPHARPLHAHTTFGKMMLAGVRHSPVVPHAFSPDWFFVDGDTLEDFGVHAKVVALPGHTLGSLGLVADDQMVVGDAMFHIARPTEAYIYEDRAMMEASVQRIYNIGVRYILPGHGRAFPTVEYFGTSP